MKKVMLLASEEMCDNLRRVLDDKYITLPCSDPTACGELLDLSPDALILNLFLPGTDGVTFLKDHAGDLPPVILALTFFISDSILQELTSLGVSSAILLPCQLGRLEKHLSDLL